MRLKQHLALIQDLLYSRKDLTVEELVIREGMPDESATIRCQLRFWDGSLLEFAESLTMRGLALAKTRYAYHYQDSAGELVFRYDNVAHHPEVVTFPHHKHISNLAGGVERIEAAWPPHLADVLSEIDQWLYRAAE